ncbi:transporter [Clostridium botulinum]|uniref:Transporter n=2 Tax=Clostridium botulinum TaxID=1491 RepID=A0A9Q1UWH3_CLOBO|nr:auxin efflux carrier family protein [Clostridium botulinum BKT015925]KEI04846.1 transporter [Clostridium botulinum C/D str. Sp77]KLU75923.1 transporter [Clostridium botulinum V891]KOA75635.1 transporter [Clostridium botulinum]MCD3197736.1 AEC family transporter [Clostridium botulinum C/D]
MKNMLNLNAVNQVGILTILILVGFYAKKKKYINDSVNKGFSDILINITSPCLILISFNFKFSNEMFLNIGKIIIFSSIIHIVLLILGKVFYLKYYNKDQQNVLKFLTLFPNCGFIGYPVLQGVYGNKAILYASIFSIPYNLLLWTYGIRLFCKNRNNTNIIKQLLSPPLIAIILGLIMFVFSIKLPYPIYRSIEMLGNMTAPIAMIITGVALAGIKVKEIFLKTNSYYPVVMRLIILPLIIYIILNTFNADKFLIEVCVIIEAMPPASLTVVFAEGYNSDVDFAARCTFLSTIVSAITIPFMISLIS